MHIVKYRAVNPRLTPRHTKIEVPGWAGAKEPRRTGSHEHAWHCLPFIEGTQPCIEILYPFDEELHVTSNATGVQFSPALNTNPATGEATPPFRRFGELYYTYQLLLDLQVEDGMAIRAEPHPSYYTSPTYDVPLAVPATLRTAWWPQIAFVVFKNPPPGITHVFRPGEPFMQFLLLPKEIPFELIPMTEDEAAARELQSMRIHASRETLAKETTWTSSTNIVFDGTYRHILGAARANGRAED